MSRTQRYWSRHPKYKDRATSLVRFMWRLRSAAYKLTPIGLTALQLHYYNLGVEAGMEAIEAQLHKDDRMLKLIRTYDD